MSSFRFFTRTALSIILVTSLAPGAAIAQWLNADNGMSERSWASRTGPGGDEIIFVWMPTLPRSNAIFALVAACNRRDDQGNPAGKNGVIFRNIQLAGVDSESFVFLSTLSEKMRRGQHRLCVWDITAQVRTTLATESAVIVGGEVWVRKKVKGFDMLTCAIAVVEMLDPGDLASATQAERLDYMRSAAVGALPSLQIHD